MNKQVKQQSRQAGRPKGAPQADAHPLADEIRPGQSLELLKELQLAVGDIDQPSGRRIWFWRRSLRPGLRDYN